ncbi:IclR family transcriptional regulator domain-containing protein [Rhizobium leguminosarum]|uniref:IclR family transcriptional regulator domain-containing protein n=1 Tax=Rhizobium leguminosarum TaxID=384 RepID=UPI00124A2FE3|nr:IclR family transcriptional regulator C-terminal domain-containing protein [Rhizobium leguminosarum]
MRTRRLHGQSNEQTTDTATRSTAFDSDKQTAGISAVGAAFFDLQGDLYAISVPTPSWRFQSHERQLTDELNSHKRADSRA